MLLQENDGNHLSGKYAHRTSHHNQFFIFHMLEVYGFWIDHSNQVLYCVIDIGS